MCKVSKPVHSWAAGGRGNPARSVGLNVAMNPHNDFQTLSNHRIELIDLVKRSTECVELDFVEGGHGMRVVRVMFSRTTCTIPYMSAEQEQQRQRVNRAHYARSDVPNAKQQCANHPVCARPRKLGSFGRSAWTMQ